jgi:hypothetical protein
LMLHVPLDCNARRAPIIASLSYPTLFMSAATATADTPLRQARRHVSAARRAGSPSRPRHTVSRMPRPLRVPRSRLVWRLGGFVTQRHE